MIRKDIVDYLHARHGALSRPELEHYSEQLLNLLKEAIQREEVTITHFGRFVHKKRSVREIHMPTGAKILSSAGDRIQFLPSPQLKTLLNSHLGTLAGDSDDEEPSNP